MPRVGRADVARRARGGGWPSRLRWRAAVSSRAAVQSQPPGRSAGQTPQHMRARAAGPGRACGGHVEHSTASVPDRARHSFRGLSGPRPEQSGQGGNRPGTARRRLSGEDNARRVSGRARSAPPNHIDCQSRGTARVRPSGPLSCSHPGGQAARARFRLSGWRGDFSRAVATGRRSRAPVFRCRAASGRKA